MGVLLFQLRSQALLGMSTLLDKGALKIQPSKSDKPLSLPGKESFGAAKLVSNYLTQYDQLKSSSLSKIENFFERIQTTPSQ